MSLSIVVVPLQKLVGIPFLSLFPPNLDLFLAVHGGSPMRAAAWRQSKGYRDPRRQENGGESLIESSPSPFPLLISRENPR